MTALAPEPQRPTDPGHRIAPPSAAELADLLELKHLRSHHLGWSPRLRARFGYHTPDEVYEALVRRLVAPGAAWLDVGCGRHLFPSNTPLAAELTRVAGRLVGVDPDANVAENPFVHEAVRGFVADLPKEQAFHLVTLRMVAEHVERPDELVADLAARTAPGGFVLIYTVNRWSPVPLITSLVPFSLHQPIKRVLWRTEKKDTFPTAFRMNTRAALRRIFERGGFDERGFWHLDDCRAFARFRPTAFLELSLWRALKSVGLHYPETCLLGVYQRR